MPTTTKTASVFTDEERGAMKERAKELRASTKRGAKADTESQVLEKIAGMAEPDRVLAERLHALIKAGAPALTPKLWYGMPAYARDGKVVCFFQSAAKFKTRYAVLGFSDEARLDDGALWPTYFALTELNPETEARVSALVRQAVS
ncbi:iron chaperone [Actinoplanes sp. CA-051413]|uniref:iron chaperone n=1 Tax=Actinoplanes sp. CA-051413 TaxID=3239899 RepID=UPI003D984F63